MENSLTKIQLLKKEGECILISDIISKIENNGNSEDIFLDILNQFKLVKNGEIDPEKLVFNKILEDSYLNQTYCINKFIQNSGIQYKPGSLLRYVIVKNGGKRKSISENMRDYNQWLTNRETINLNYYIRRISNAFIGEDFNRTISEIDLPLPDFIVNFINESDLIDTDLELLCKYLFYFY